MHTKNNMSPAASQTEREYALITPHTAAASSSSSSSSAHALSGVMVVGGGGGSAHHSLLHGTATDQKWDIDPREIKFAADIKEESGISFSQR
jgi:hypothetical protein